MNSAYSEAHFTPPLNDKPDYYDLSDPSQYGQAIADNTLNIFNRGKNQQQVINTLQAQSYNSAEAQKNRDWQEMLSNTAHQREVADLQAAGLNTWLSADGQGSSTPAGGAASSTAANATDFAGPALIHSLTSIAGSIIGLFGHKGAGKAVSAAGKTLAAGASSAAAAKNVSEVSDTVQKAVEYGEKQRDLASWTDFYRKGSKNWQRVREAMGYEGSSFIKSD